MIPWKLLDRAAMPGGSEELLLFQRGNDFSLRLGKHELMPSSAHGSEEVLAELACARVAQRVRPRVLVGGLGMGYTLAAALRHLGPTAEVVVAEIAPAVVAWNRGPLADLAGRPLFDPRVVVREEDFARVLRSEVAGFDAILNDVDNGPQGLLREANDWLYGRGGLEATLRALRPAGVLSVWSVAPDRAFSRRLALAGFKVEEVVARARGKRGGRYWIWVATRDARPKASSTRSSGSPRRR